MLSVSADYLCKIKTVNQHQPAEWHDAAEGQFR